MRRGAVTILSFLIAVIGCARPPELRNGELHVSLVQILVYPERLAPGQGVAVYGFLSAEPQLNSWLYLTEAHARARDLLSAVVLNTEALLESTPCVDRFVRVYGSLKSFGGESRIYDISKIEIARVERESPNVFRMPEVCYRGE